MPATQAPSAFTYEPTSDATLRSPSVVRRFAERFALIAFGLYHIPLFLNNYPSLGGGGFNDTGLAPRWGHVFTPPAVWVARHVFHLNGPMPSAYQGDNGDVSEEYARLFLAVVIGVIGAIIWTFKDRRRPHATWVESTLRVMLRYAIVLGIISYGVAKIFPQQFPPISAGTLEQRVGDLTPMSLLWTFMEYSRPYAFFGGLMELVAVGLLCFRRTALAGALLCLAVMTNVALLNYAYGVPVKLYATMIAVSAAVLVLYDTRRLLDFFARNRVPAEDRQSTELQDRFSAPWRWTIKTLAVGSVTLSSVVAMAPTMHPPATAPTDGVWIVTSNDAAAPWRRLVINPFAVSIRTAADSTIGCRRATAADPTSFTLQCARGHKGELRWSRLQDTLRLDGTFDSAAVHVAARLVDRQKYVLLRGKFKWIFD
jgi:hypothetical protein